MKHSTFARLAISRSLGTLIILSLASLLFACSGADHAAQIERHQRLASELQNNQLYTAAIEEYQKILSYDDATTHQRANINYLMARLYYEKLSDYRNAAAHYLRAREYDPEGSFVTEASKKLVASLEKLGNVADARRQLEAATNVGGEPASNDDVVVARVGSRDIWLSEIDAQIILLQPEVQQQLVHLEAKKNYVRQYVGIELLYNAAIREDYESDPEVQRQKEQLVKRILVDKFVGSKVMPQVIVDTLDVRNFYRANVDSLYGGAPFDSVAVQAYRDCQNQKAEVAYNEYIAQLAKAEQVEFLDHNVR